MSTDKSLHRKLTPLNKLYLCQKEKLITKETKLKNRLIFSNNRFQGHQNHKLFSLNILQEQKNPLPAPWSAQCCFHL